MTLSWKTGGLALGLVFFAAVLLVKPIGVSTQFVILDGILYAYDFASIKEMFTEVAKQVVERTDPMPFDRRSSGLGGEVWTLYNLVDNQRALAEIIESSPLPEDETYLTLYAMLILRLFDRRRDLEEQPAVAKAEPVAMKDEQAGIIEDLVIEGEEPSRVEKELTPIDEVEAGEEEISEEELAEQMAGELERELKAFEEGGKGEDLTRIDETKPDLAKLEEQIVSHYLKLEGANYYDLLGVPQDADDLKVEYAYQEKVKLFHEDKIGKLYDPALEKKAATVMQAIETAYRTLSSPMKRADYDRRLTPEGEELKERRITTILAAERAFNQGLLALRRGAFTQAEEHFQEACELFPEEAEYYAYLGWVHFNNPKIHEQQRVVLAKEAIEKSLKINPKGDKAHFFLGKIFLAHGSKEKARKMFALSFRYNKNNEEAKAELRRLQLEKDKERQELDALEEKEKLGSRLKADIDFKSVKKAIKKLFW